MRICVDARMILSSGIGTLIQNFLINFKSEFDLILIGEESKISPFISYKWRVTLIETHIKIYSLQEQIFFVRNIPECDLFWSPHYNVPLLPIKAKRRVVNINDVFHLAFSSEMTLSQRLYSNIVIRGASKMSDLIITISNFSKSEIEKYVPQSKSKMEVIYCGVDTRLFSQAKDEHLLNQVKQKYELPSKYILCVGNIKPHKNLKRLIEALSLIGEKLEDYNLVIVGKKEGFITGDPLLFKLIDDNKFLRDRVKFTGYVPNSDLPYIYSMASLFIFPSYYEGFGLPPLEAMACGCPTLVSNVASMPEICGDAAQYFNPYDTVDMADKILKALSNNSNSEYVNKGLERCKIFSWTNYYESQISLFHQVLKK